MVKITSEFNQWAIICLIRFCSCCKLSTGLQPPPAGRVLEGERKLLRGDNFAEEILAEFIFADLL